MANINYKDQYKLITEDNSTIEEKIEYLTYLVCNLANENKEEKEELIQLINDLKSKENE